MLLAETGEQFHEEERVPLHAFGQGQQGIVGSGAEDVSDHFGDSGLIQAPENRLAGPVAELLGGSVPQIAACLGGTKGQHPAHRQGSQAGRQSAYRRPGAALSPLQVVQADQDRVAQSGLLQQRLDVLQQPVTLLAGGVRIPECRTLEQRLRPLEQRVHQHGQLHGRIAGLGHAVADSETRLLGGRHSLFHQAALTEPRAAFNQPAEPGPAPKPCQMIPQQRNLAIPAPQRIRHAGVRSIDPARSHRRPAADPAITRHGRLPHGMIAPLRHGHTGDGTGRSCPSASARRLRGRWRHDQSSCGTSLRREGGAAGRSRLMAGSCARLVIPSFGKMR